MNCRGDIIILLAAISAVAAAHGLAAQANATDEPGGNKTSPLTSVNIDEETCEYIDSARKMVARKDYADAIDILQGLLERRKCCFVPTEDPCLFVSQSVKVNEVIGQLPPEGMELYRRLYDARAERLFRTAAERLDEHALRDIVRRYFHTSYGGDALNLLGGILFDRGEFSQAACCWGRIISAHVGARTKPAEVPALSLRSSAGFSKGLCAGEAVLMSKVAVAHHLAGESARAAEAMDLLTKRHPKATATLGGKMENVLAFTQRMLTLPPPRSAGPCPQQDWPCLAGTPNSAAVMSPCQPVLSLRWTAPGGRLKDNPNIKAALLGVSPTPSHMSEPAPEPLREGRVIFMRRRFTSVRKELMPLPALIHPIAVGSIVLYRSGDGLVACDLPSGEKLWQSAPLPLYRRSSKSIGQYIPYPMPVEDQGLWTLTAGGGKVFAVGGFLPHSINYYRMAVRRGAPPPRQFADTSVLAAFSISGKGRPLWRIDGGDETNDLTEGCKFLTAPTYLAGRLYVLVESISAHHLVCLDAEDGRLVWRAVVAQTPVRANRFTRNTGWRQSLGSPPAVAYGKVFAVTNTGVVAAFEARTGRPVWAYQYRRDANWRGAGRVGGRSYPPNPVIAAGGKVICLPADSGRLLALRADTGRSEWSNDRRGQRNLSAMSGSRLLLSGGGIHVIDAATGRRVWTDDKVGDVHGRPAVTPKAILASGAGQIIRISLKDFAVTRLPLLKDDVILGNLICADGKLLAANAAGLSAYFPR